MPLRRSLALLLRSVALSAALGAGVAGSAQAASVSAVGGSLSYSAGGEANRVTLTLAPDAITVEDPGSDLTPGTGCWRLPAGLVGCGTAVSAVAVDTGAGNDVVTVRGALPATLDGGDGDDRLTGGAGADRLRGGDDDDVLDGGAGADVLYGGYGWDTATYAARSAAVAVDLDGRADDGERDERDDVRSDVDALVGGGGDDVLAGTSYANTLDGGPGADVLRGQGRDDRLFGGPGADALDGGEGNDVVNGGDGGDALEGGAGIDTADYAERWARVDVRLDGLANDGELAEGDGVGGTVERVQGGGGDDVLTGAAAAETLLGGGGRDTLDGRDGDDTLDGGGDGDALVGGGGDDRLGGGDGDDALDGSGGADDLVGGAGVDRADYSSRVEPVVADFDGAWDDGQPGEADRLGRDVEGAAGGAAADRLSGDGDANVLDGGGGDDVVTGGGGDDTLDGGAGADDLDGGSGADGLDGGDGDDVLDGGWNADVLGGGAGRDRADYSDRTGRVTVTLDGAADDGHAGEDDDVRADVEVVAGGTAGDALTGGDGDEDLLGGAGADELRGNGGADRLDAGPGDDRLAGGAGADVLDGGEGDDVADHAGSAEPVRLSLDEGAAGDGDRVTAIEHVLGGPAGDRLEGDGGDNQLSGAGGDDVLDGGPGPDVLDGGDGRDTADYSSRTASVTVTDDDRDDDGEPGEGDDVQPSVDAVVGGAGADVITLAGEADQRLRGGGGNDRLGTGLGADRLDGEAGNDVLESGPGADDLRGGSGRDTLRGGPGRDRLDAGAGDDALEAVDGVREEIRCGPGRDRVRADRRDRLVSCERRLPVAAPQPPPAPSGPPEPVAPSEKVAGARTVVGGGRFVAIPGFPGERIDRRLLRDIAYLRREYRIHVTDGYALTGHAAAGEHPRGLAIDVVPGSGATWDDIDRLARWAEPRPGRPRAPFRWVGYDGDPGHGRGHHLHLSWRHAPVPSGRPARWVQVLDLREPAGRRLRLAPLARTSNFRLGRRPSVRSGLRGARPCRGAAQLQPTWQAAGRAFGISWKILAAITEIESAFGCNMGPSSAGAIGWTQFMPATWRMWGMDANGDGRASPYSSADAVFSSARYLRASGAPGSYRRALYAYNHAWWYVRDVLRRARRY